MPRLFNVTDALSARQDELLARACAARDVELVTVWAPAADTRSLPAPAPGDLLYRSALTIAAQRLEQLLLVPGVASFHVFAHRVFYAALNSTLVLERAGVPVPPTSLVPASALEGIAGHVDALGGFPLVLKVEGGEGGFGVMRVDSLPALRSLLEYTASSCPLLMAYVADAVHWRVIVVGDAAVAAYPNPTRAHDFRSEPSDSAGDYLELVPRDLEELAVRATQVLDFEHAGVDLLRRPDGSLVVLEVNFPCYFPQAQVAAGIDVAGAMLDHLLAKAARLQAELAEGGELRPS